MPGLVAVVDFHARPELPARYARARGLLHARSDAIREDWREPEGRAMLGRVDNRIFNPAPQPVTSHDGRYRLFFQGELYERARKLAQLSARGIPLTGESHADLLLATFRADGLAGLEQLNGAFFFLLWDARQQTLLVGSDRHASRPHFYAIDHERLIIAPEVRAVAAALEHPARLSRLGLAEFLGLEHPLADHTFYEGIKAFPGGTFLLAGRMGTRWEVYWAPRYVHAEFPPRSQAALLEEACHLYRQAVERRLEPPCSLSLSGGTDSRLLLAAAGRRDLACFTFGQVDSEDHRFATQAAAAAGNWHRFFPLRPDFLAYYAHSVVARGEGMSSLFHAHNLDGLEAIRQVAPVALYGASPDYARLDFADNLLSPPAASPLARLVQLAVQGLRGEPLHSLFKDDLALARRVAERSWNVLTPSLMSRLLVPELAAMATPLAEAIAAQVALIPGPTPTDRMILFNLLHRQRRFTQWALSMGADVLEARKPFEDYDLVDFLLSLPPAQRRRLQVQVLCRLSPTLAGIPRSGTGVAPNAGVARRTAAVLGREIGQLRHTARRQCFADPQESLRTHARRFYEDLLLDPATLQNGFFNPQGVQELVRAHMDRKADAASALCALATLELWRRQEQIQAPGSSVIML